MKPCPTGEHAYATKAEAMAQGARCLFKPVKHRKRSYQNEQFPALSAYRCPQCGAWHLTHKID